MQSRTEKHFTFDGDESIENSLKRSNTCLNDDSQPASKKSDVVSSEEPSHARKKSRQEETNPESDISQKSVEVIEPETFPEQSFEYDPDLGFVIDEPQLNVDQTWDALIAHYENTPPRTYYLMSGQPLSIYESQISKKLINYSLISKWDRKGRKIDSEIFSDEQYLNMKSKAEETGIHLNQYKTYLEFFDAYQSIQQYKLDQQLERLKNANPETHFRKIISSEEASAFDAAITAKNYANAYQAVSKKIEDLTKAISSHEQKLSDELQLAVVFKLRKEKIQQDLDALWEQTINEINKLGGSDQNDHERENTRTIHEQIVRNAKITDEQLRADMLNASKTEKDYNKSAQSIADQIHSIQKRIPALITSADFYQEQSNLFEAKKTEHLKNIEKLKLEFARLTSIYQSTFPLYNSANTTSTSTTTTSSKETDNNPQPKV